MAQRNIKNIMILIDGGSPQSFRAAEYAIGLAKTVGCPLTATAVIDTETLRQLLTYRILASDEMTEFQFELEQTTRKYLDRVQHMAQEEQVDISPVLVYGPYHTAVLGQQKEQAADLIVMGGFDSNLSNRDLMVREFQKIVDQAPCSILLVK